ncbi:MAG: hypothetical protein VYA34_10885 [Myxococcota bacterium]|nr:hypothetical protein [Myxococcota bacterium]
MMRGLIVAIVLMGTVGPVHADTGKLSPKSAAPVIKLEGFEVRVDGALPMSLYLERRANQRLALLLRVRVRFRNELIQSFEMFLDRYDSF